MIATLLVLAYMVGFLVAAVQRQTCMEANAEYDDWSWWQSALITSIEGLIWPVNVLLKGRGYLANMMLELATTCADTSNKLASWSREIR